MKRGLAIVGIFVVLGALAPASDAGELDRRALVALMEQYLAALASHDPSRVPLAGEVKLVENTEVTPMGEGLWKSATGGPSDFRIFAADPVAGEVGFLGVVEENEKPTILAARLKVVAGRITEIDHLVVHSDGRPLSPHMAKPRPGLVQPLEPSERVPRDQMLKIANSYYEAIVQDDGRVAPFADECQRREKVMKIIGVPGITERPNRWGPFDLPAAHVFKIRNGRIHEIEAIGYMARHGVASGWE